MNASLVAADLSAAVLTGARLRKAHFWKTVPPRAQDVAWVDLSDIDTGEPTSDKKQDIMQSISVIPERSASANLSFQRLKRAVGVEESFIASDGEELDIWRDWSSALSRSPSDPIYQKAVSQIIVDLACHGSEFAAAILRWNKPSTDYYFDTFSPNPLPAPPEDPSLKQVRDAPRYPNTYYGSYEMAPGPVNPLPEWFDLKLLSTTFGGGQCSSADSLPADFVATLEADEQIRRESSVRRRTSN
jgi:hypothetical protein